MKLWPKHKRIVKTIKYIVIGWIIAAAGVLITGETNYHAIGLVIVFLGITLGGVGIILFWINVIRSFLE